MMIISAGSVAVLTTMLAGATAGVATSLVLATALLFDAGFWVQTGQGLAWHMVGIAWLAQCDNSPLGFARLAPLPATWVAVTRGRRHPIDVGVGAVRLIDDAPAPTAPPEIRPVPGSLPPNGPRLPEPANPASQFEVESETTPQLLPAQGATRDAMPPHYGAGSPVRVMVDGQARHTLTTTAVVGRRPALDSPDVTLITLTDLSRTISKSHLRLDLQDDGRLRITDLGSTNGSSVVYEGGASQPLVPFEPMVIDIKDHVALGDHTLTFALGGAT